MKQFFFMLLMLVAFTGQAGDRSRYEEALLMNIEYVQDKTPNGTTITRVNEYQIETRDNYSPSAYFFTFKKGDVLYVTRYWDGIFKKDPTEFVINDKIWVRESGKKIYIKRPNGKEMKTTVMRKEKLK
ncbi:hypothetical protein K1X76_06640 [bacterium]|nr:hypothetical protein [bacterium]